MSPIPVPTEDSSMVDTASDAATDARPDEAAQDGTAQDGSGCAQPEPCERCPMPDVLAYIAQPPVRTWHRRHPQRWALAQQVVVAVVVVGALLALLATLS